MKVYKVVYENRKNEKFSIWARGKASVKYEVGKWVKAPEWLREKGYHLLVFKSKEMAMVWVEFHTELCPEIWLAEAKGIFEKLPPFLDVNELIEGKILKSDFVFPTDTIMAEEVMLIRKVYPPK